MAGWSLRQAISRRLGFVSGLLGVVVALSPLATGCGGSSSSTAGSKTLPPAEYGAEQQVVAYVRAYDSALAPFTHPPANPRDLRHALALEDQAIATLKGTVPPPRFESDHRALIGALESERTAIGQVGSAVANHNPVAASNAEARNVAGQAAVNAAIQKLASDIGTCLKAHNCSS
jgi:hypothetical protein